MTVVNRHVFREVLGASLLALLTLLGLFTFFDFVGELSDLGRGEYGLGDIVAYVTLTMPSHVYELVPISGLIGAMLALGQMTAHSELAVLRSSGLAPRRLAGWLLQVSLALTAVAFLFGEFIAPASETAAQRLRVQATSPVVAQEFRSGLWVKDEQTFVNVRQVLPDNELRDITIYAFDASHHLSRVGHAASGQWDDGGHWRLENVHYTEFVGENARAGVLGAFDWRSALTPELLDVLLVDPEQMSASRLSSYVEHLQDNRQDALRFEIALWGKYFYPVTIAVMLLLALPFALGGRSRMSMGGRMFAGILVGIAYFILNRVFGHLSLLNEWPPMIAAAVPPAIILTAGVLMTWWVERR